MQKTGVASHGFDKLARPYRWLEYLTFGRALERCRFTFLPELAGARHVLVLGDGDGRFTARLLQAAPKAQVLAVDASQTMLHQLRRRCRTVSDEDRVQTYLADLAAPFPQLIGQNRFDLVVTHFFLDCLTQHEMEALVQQVTPLLLPGARWVISEFSLAPGWWLGPSWLLVRLLYLAFRMLTGLRTQQLPEYAWVLERHGFRREHQASLIRGLLVAQLWRR